MATEHDLLWWGSAPLHQHTPHSNSTESHDQFVIKKAVGLVFGIISAIASAGIYFALRRIVYPPGENDPDEDDTSAGDEGGGSAAPASASVYLIVLKLFMATAVSDIIFATNNVLTFSDWRDDSWECELRGAWFQVGFQSSFCFTAFTALELYLMITQTRFNKSSARTARKRFVRYVVSNVTFTVVVVAVLASSNAFGGLSKSRGHTQCYITPGAGLWAQVLGMAPSFIAWMSCCLFVGLAARKLCVLTREAERELPSTRARAASRRSAGGRWGGQGLKGGEDEDFDARLDEDVFHEQQARQQAVNARARFLQFIRKMLMFPLSTFFIWLLPLLFVLLGLERSQFFWLELVVTACVNSNGLKNAVMLLCTNALVRQEVKSWLTCHCGAGGDGGGGESGGSGGGRGERAGSALSFRDVGYSDSLLDDADGYYDDEEAYDYYGGGGRGGGGSYGRGGGGNGGGGLTGNGRSGQGPMYRPPAGSGSLQDGRLPDRDRADTEDVVIAPMSGGEEGEFGYLHHSERRSGGGGGRRSRGGVGGGGGRRVERGRASISGVMRSESTPSLPSLGGGSVGSRGSLNSTPPRFR